MRDALVAWADGALIPGVCPSLEDPTKTIPCAYTETYGNGNNLLVFTHEGISFGEAESYGLSSSLFQQWVNTPTALLDADKLKNLLREHSLTSLMLTAPCSAPDVVLRRNGPSVTRYAQGMWCELLRNPEIIPEFPDQATCFEWLALTTKQNGAVKADELFELLRASTICSWLKTEADWVILTEYLRSCDIENLDDVEKLPASTEAFVGWLFSSSKLRETNFRTLLTFMVAGQAPRKDVPDRLLALVKAWESDDKDMFYRARSVVKNWLNLIPILCNMRAPGENVRNSIWTFFENAFSRDDEFAEITNAISVHNELPDEAWTKALTYYLNLRKITWQGVPEKWALSAMQEYCEGRVVYSASAVTEFAKPYFQNTDIGNCIPLFEKILSRIVQAVGPAAVSPQELFEYSLACWPSKKPIWDVCVGLDLTLSDWAAQAGLLLQKSTTVELPAGLSDYYESESF